MAGNLRRVATLPAPPAHKSPSLLDAERKRSATQHGMAPHIPEPFASISAQQLVQENCRHCGMIRKESGRVKIWQDRYLILHKGCMYYYSSPEASSAQGQFSLSGYRVSHAPEKLKYQWTFKLVHYQPEKRTYHFAAHSEREMNIWMDNIQEDTAEYASYDKRDENTEISDKEDTVDDFDGSEGEYSYAEVEPLFIKEDFILQCSGPDIAAAQSTDFEEHLYCPPPDFPQDSTFAESSLQPTTAQLALPSSPSITRKPKPLPLIPFKFPTSPSTGKKVAVPPAPQPKPKENLWQTSLKHPPPVVPPRKTSKDAAVSKTPPQVPKAKPRKQDVPKHSTPPVGLRTQKSDMSQLIKEMNKTIVLPTQAELTSRCRRTTAKEGLKETDEDYLPLASEEKKSTLERGFPEGMSIKSPQPEIQCPRQVLPLSAKRLDLDKTAVVPLLQKRTGMYMIHSSQTAQSKQAISVCTNDRVRPYLIFHDKNLGYALDPKGPRFATIKELIMYYYDNSLPTCDCKLSRPYKA